MRLHALVWGTLSIVAAGALSAGLGPDLGPIPEVGHLVGHVVLFGVFAVLLARATERSASFVCAATVAVGGLVELAQMLGSGHLLLREGSYDVAIDGLSGLLGLSVARPAPAAKLIGVALHPALVLPLGLFGTFYASQRDPIVAAIWTAIGVGSLAPVGLLWLVGVHRGWFTEVDLIARAERPALFVAATVSTLGFALVAGTFAPQSIAVVALGLTWFALGITLVTAAGFKASGHVAVSVLLALAITPWSTRGPPLFLASAALLSWARVKAGCHHPAEVAGGWMLAYGASGWNTTVASVVAGSARSVTFTP